MFSIGGRALDELGGASLPNSTKLRIPILESAAVGLCEMSFIVERETTQTDG
jgi:hypothetical protein